MELVELDPMSKKMWKGHEFLGDVLEAGLKYYFTPDINGTLVIYDPKEETHNFIEEAPHG